MKNPETLETEMAAMIDAGTRRFPVLLTYEERQRAKHLPYGCPASVPWSLLEPHQAQAQRNHHQDLETLARRGGLGPDEMMAVIEDRPWRHMDLSRAVYELRTTLGYREREPDEGK